MIMEVFFYPNYSAYIYSMILQPQLLTPINHSRIISLVPSQTELLHYLGLNEQIVGITKFCIHPNNWFTTKARVGGTKNINFNTIKKLQPTLIIANKEENVKDQIEALATNYPVLLTDVNNVTDGIKMILQIGQLTATTAAAIQLTQKITTAFATINKPKQQLNTAYLIWKDPYMAAGGSTFITDILSKSGFKNIFATKNRYPQINIKDLQNANCQLLLLSSEPYPFKQKHINQLQQQLPNTKIILVDGEMFSWYGSRMLLMPNYINNLIKDINY
jgi:ABC-type Fe3+-hydroxamate transport system substrate-binding protein